MSLILNQTQGHGVTEKYTPVTTQTLIDQLVSKGYTQTDLKTTRVRKASKEGFQKHMVRLSHNEMQLKNVGDTRPEIVLVNSYDGLSSLRIMLGLFRLICGNGLIVGTTFAGFNVRHVGEIMPQIETGLNQIAAKLPEVAEKIEEFSKTTLTQDQMTQFATSAAKLVLPDSVSHFDINSLLKVRRNGDQGDSKWVVFNRVQEALVRGGIKYVSEYQNDAGEKLYRNGTTRQIKAIDRLTEVNQKAWDLIAS